MKLYNIAGHYVSIDFKDEKFDEKLLPNFSPFVSPMQWPQINLV